MCNKENSIQKTFTHSSVSRLESRVSGLESRILFLVFTLVCTLIVAPTFLFAEIENDIEVNKDNVELAMDLALQYGKLGQKDKALKLYNSVLEVSKEDKKIWLAVIYAMYELNWEQDLARILEEYTQKYPSDKEQAKNLTHIYLYVQQREALYPYYLNYVKKFRDQEIARDVGYMLQNKNKINQAHEWTAKMHKLFPNSNDILDLYLDILFTEKKYNEAIRILEAKSPRTQEQEQLLGDFYEYAQDTQRSLDIYEKLLDKNPKDPELIDKVSSLHSLIGNKQKSETYFTKLAEDSPNDVSTLKSVAKELLFLGEPKKSLVYFNKAKDLSPSDAEVWYWIAEASYLDKQKDQERKASSKVIELLDTKPNLSEAETQYLLKAKGRLGYSPQLADAYEDAFVRYPSNIEFRLDWIELLVIHGKVNEAEQALEDTKRQFPELRKNLLPYESSIAFQRSEWKRAVSLLEEILLDAPNEWTYKPDLAEAYTQSGKFSRAIDEYDEIQRHTNIQVSEKLRDIHEFYDHRVTSGWKYIKNGNEDGHLFGAYYQGFVNDFIQPTLDLEGGVFNNNTLGVTNKNLVYTQFALNIHKYPQLIITPGVGYGTSDFRSVVSPFIEVTYRELYWLKLISGYRYQELRRDIPEAVIAGALESRAYFKWEVVIIKKFILSGQYHYLYETLPGGDSAFIHEVTPGLAYIILENKPYVSIGYVHVNRNLTEKGSFLTNLSLLDRVTSHSIVLYAAHRMLQGRLFVEGSVSTGSDPARGINFFELWGVTAAFRLAMNKWLDLLGSFELTSETLTGVAGNSYNIGVYLSAHWD